MKFQNLYRKTNMKTAIGLVFMLCIMLSSCAVKGSIKNLLELHPKAKSNSAAFQNKFLTAGVTSACNFCKEKELTVTGIEKSKVKSIHPGELFTAVIQRLRFIPQDIPHTVYRSSEVLSELPLFIQYRKLII